jgi:ATP-dependent Lhr-like helicase
MREPPEDPRALIIAATDPANPYGSTVKWPEGGNPTRTAGALVILVDGVLAGYLRRGERELLLFVPDTEPQRARLTRATARALVGLTRHRGMLIADINGAPATSHSCASLFVEAGFATTAMGLQLRPMPHANREPEPEPNRENREG